MIFDFEKEAPFDPGFTKYLSGIFPQIQILEQNFSVGNLNQKKFQFKMAYPKIIKTLNTHLGFYLGCLFWASYIKQFEDKPITGNKCVKEVYNEEDSLFEVNFIKNFIEKFKKDYKFYTGKDYVFDDFKLKILEKYEEFLKLNKGFSQELTTSTLEIPKLKKITKKGLKEAFEVINEVIATGDFEKFFTIYDKLI